MTRIADRLVFEVYSKMNVEWHQKVVFFVRLVDGDFVLRHGIPIFAPIRGGAGISRVMLAVALILLTGVDR